MAGITYKPLTTNTAARTGRHPFGVYAGLWDRKQRIIERDVRPLRRTRDPERRHPELYRASFPWREVFIRHEWMDDPSIRNEVDE